MAHGDDRALAAELIASARRGEPDRYLAATLAPVGCQGDLITLAAFASELTLIERTTTDPWVGMVRLKWWRDALVAPVGPSGHPIADATTALIARRRLPMVLVETAIASRADGLACDPAETMNASAARFADQEGSLFRLALHILCAPDGPDTDRLARLAGAAYGLARSDKSWRGLADASERNHPAHAILSVDVEQAMRDIAPFVYRLDRRTRTALLPLAMVRPYLASQRRGRDAATGAPAEPVPLARLCRILLTHVTGRF